MVSFHYFLTLRKEQDVQKKSALWIRDHSVRAQRHRVPKLVALLKKPTPDKRDKLHISEHVQKQGEPERRMFLRSVETLINWFLL